MPENQAHGKAWEKSVLRGVYGLTESEIETIKHTEIHDLPQFMNKIGNYNLSIKTTGTAGKVDTGNVQRIFEASGSYTPYHMIVVIYKQDEHVKRLVEILELNLSRSRELLFGTVTLEEIDILERLIQSVPKGRSPTPEERRVIYQTRDAISGHSGIFNFNPKMDSKTQRRLQGSMKYPEDRIITRSSSGNFMGGHVMEEHASGRRQRRPRV